MGLTLVPARPVPAALACRIRDFAGAHPDGHVPGGRLGKLDQWYFRAKGLAEEGRAGLGADGKTARLSDSVW